MLVDDILQGVDDDTPLASCILFESPLKDLVLAYNQLSIANPDIPSFSANCIAVVKSSIPALISCEL